MQTWFSLKMILKQMIFCCQFYSHNFNLLLLKNLVILEISMENLKTQRTQKIFHNTLKYVF